MNYIADLHTHSPYSRATSTGSTLAELYGWAKLKGINVVASGDFTHPQWFSALKGLLEPAEPGLFRLKDEAAVKAMSRTGDRREILRGPLFYGLVFVAVTLIYWKDSLIGIPALMIMCGGDGIADIVGRRVPSPKLPWSREKSVAGSLSVFLGGWLLTIFIFAIYVWVGAFPGPLAHFFLPITWIALGATLVESLPFRDVDNLTVTLAAVLIGYLVF